MIYAGGQSNGRAVASVTVGGISATQVISASENISANGGHLSLWALANPPTGSQTINIAWNASTDGAVAVAISLNGTDGTYAHAVSSTSSTLNVTSDSAQDFISDGVFVDLISTCGTYTPGGSQTTQWNICTDATDVLFGSTAGGSSGGSVAMSWNAASLHIGVDVHAEVVPSDISSPIVTAFSIPSTATSNIINISTFSATDNVLVTGYKLTESSTPPLSGDVGWTVSAPTTYTFSSSGPKTLYAWAKDAAGNISTSASANTTITIVAGNHYVLSSATGSGTGENWTDAFTTIPEFLIRGDTYYIGDGTYGAVNFNDNISGTTMIYLKKATASDHGTNIGWQSIFGDGTAIFPSVAFLKSYYDFDGVSGGGPSSWNTGFGFEITRSVPTICRDNGKLISIGSVGSPVSNINIKHSHIHAENNNYPTDGVKGVFGASNINFSYNYLHTTLGPSFHIGSWTDSTIEYNYIADVRSTGTTDSLGYCNDWHSEAVSSIGINQNLVFRHNIWDDIEGTAVFAGVNIGESINWKIYGNVFYRSSTTINYVYEVPGTNQQTMTGLKFYNNNIINIPDISQGGIVINSGSNNEVYNNIWYNNIANSFNMSSSISHDYNYFSENRRVQGCSPVCDKNAEGATGESFAQIGSGSPFVNTTIDPSFQDRTNSN